MAILAHGIDVNATAGSPWDRQQLHLSQLATLKRARAKQVARCCKGIQEVRRGSLAALSVLGTVWNISELNVDSARFCYMVGIAVKSSR